MIERIEYPITIKRIKFETVPTIESGSWDRDIGKFVAVRPVDSICPAMKTYLGLYIGEARVGQSVSHNPDTGELTIRQGHSNPVIFVFDLNRVVMGYESWWGVIENEDDLHQITDADINNAWYMRMLRKITEQNKAAK